MRPRGVFGSLLLVAATASHSAGQTPLPRESDYVYGPIPDVAISDARGELVRLADRWRERPLLLTMVFTRCVGGCPLYVRSLRAAIAATGGLGREYDVVVLSFDPRDTWESMADLAALHGLDESAGWTFGTASPPEVERLAHSIGFWSEWDESRSQFDHPTMLAAVDRGRVVRLLVGAEVSQGRLREVIWELRGALVPTYPLPSTGVIFRCFDVDSRTGSVRLDWGLLLLLTPGIAMLVGTALIFRSGARPPSAPRAAQAERTPR